MVGRLAEHANVPLVDVVAQETLFKTCETSST
jgi:hypothetical protein